MAPLAIMIGMRGKIVEGGIYHVLNRGVDKRRIFLNDKDYIRFIHDLFEFNDKDTVLNTGIYFRKNIHSSDQHIDVGRRYVDSKKATAKKPRKCLVDVLAFALMPNHYHLLVRARSGSGVAEFMKKVNGGYAKYFNLKYERVGTLFCGRYKSVPVTNQRHLIHLPYYIHLNPLDLIAPEWRDKQMQDIGKAIKFLERYRWSSYLDYIGRKNFPSVTQRDFLTELVGGPKDYRKDTMKWLKTMDASELQTEHLTLD